MKDFDIWNRKKKGIEDNPEQTVIFHKGEIWWCSIGLNIGSEQDGKNNHFARPVFILKKFNNQMAWIVPSTSKFKESGFYYATETAPNAFNLILSQLRVVSVKRLKRRICKLSLQETLLITSKIIQILKRE